ncbi:hypothetical protein LR48_Vigan04g000500 [Vigna angularis]|uniref:Uncharacterized protein n=1 Tax=Phaseolus angularis TaxID=3914 RepID=A0A0L9UB66_PHAAN|nr:hypothetical protein LR48_Vigan04g000500 [Vigna angularis]
MRKCQGGRPPGLEHGAARGVGGRPPGLEYAVRSSALTVCDRPPVFGEYPTARLGVRSGVRPSRHRPPGLHQLERKCPPVSNVRDRSSACLQRSPSVVRPLKCVLTGSARIQSKHIVS